MLLYRANAAAVAPPIRFVGLPEARSDPCVHRALTELHPLFETGTTFVRPLSVSTLMKHRARIPHTSLPRYFGHSRPLGK